MSNTSNTLILVLKATDKIHLGAIRCYPNLQAAVDGDLIWLKGIPAQDTIDLKIKQLPVKESYWLDDKNRLFPIGGLTPIGRLKSLNWQALTQFLPIEVPVAAYAGKTDKQHPLQLVNSKEEKNTAALLTDLATWKKYVETAPFTRLQPLRFAVSETASVLIIGKPLPPIIGQAFWLTHQLLLPNGLDFDLPSIAILLSKQLSAAEMDYLLFDKMGNWERISMNNFVKATRSGVRLTVR